MKLGRVKGISGEDEGFCWRAVSRCLNALLIVCEFPHFCKGYWIDPKSRKGIIFYYFKVHLTYFNLFALNGVEILCVHRNPRNILNSVTLGFLSS